MFRILSRRLIVPAVLLSLFSSLPACVFAQNNTPADDSVLRFALIFSRHGVRPPTKDNDAYADYSAQPWPDWPVEPGYLTPHGRQLMVLMGQYYRAYFKQQGLLSGDTSTDGGRVYIDADSSERTMKTAEGLSEGLLPGAAPQIKSAAPGDTDSLFSDKGAPGTFDRSLAEAARAGREGGDPSSVLAPYGADIALLGTVLGKPFTGTLDQAATLAEILVLEYAEGMPANEVGWGRATAAQIAEIDQLHTFGMQLKSRTPYSAQSAASKMLVHIGQTLRQAETGQAQRDSVGTSDAKLVVLVGHDGQIASLGGLLHADWQIPSYAWDDVPPGGAIVFELRRHKDNTDFVRVYYVAQTLDQQHSATPLTTQAGPAIVPIFIPGASTATPSFDCPYEEFEKAVEADAQP